MPDLSISSAAALTGANLASGDLFPVLDISASAGSKGSSITSSQLVEGLMNLGVSNFSAFSYGTPVAWYAAADQGTTDGASLTTLIDRSGNGNNATAGSGITLRMAGGVRGASMVFDTGTATLPDAISLSSRAFTVLIVARLNSVRGQQIYTSLGRTGAGTGQLNIFNQDGSIRTFASSGGAFNSTVYPHGDLQVIAATGGASAFTVYADGQTNATSALTQVTLTGGKIGESYAGGASWQAEVLHIAIYASELSTATLNQARSKIAELHNEQDATTGTLLATVGDSITRGFGVGPNSWPRQAVQRLRQPVRLITAGLDGSNLTGSGNPDLAYSAAFGRKICVVFLGTNDLDAGTAGTTLHTTLNTYCTARQSAGWQVIVCNCLPRTVAGSWSAANETERLAYNSAIATNWASYASVFVDLAGDTRLATPGSTVFYQDGLHPTAAGQAVIAEKIVKAIESLY